MRSTWNGELPWRQRGGACCGDTNRPACRSLHHARPPLTSTHLHVADVLPAPQRLKHQVGKAKHRQVLNQLLALCGRDTRKSRDGCAGSRAAPCSVWGVLRLQAMAGASHTFRTSTSAPTHQVVVDAVDLVLPQEAVQLVAELAERLAVLPKRLLHNHARPAAPEEGGDGGQLAAGCSSETRVRQLAREYTRTATCSLGWALLLLLRPWGCTARGSIAMPLPLARPPTCWRLPWRRMRPRR